MRSPEDALVLLLAGGVGSRLNLLVESRAKPAVPFGGWYRIIDFSLSISFFSEVSLDYFGIILDFFRTAFGDF